MWRLTITRRFDFVCCDGQVIKDMEHKMVYEALNVGSLATIIENTKRFGVDRTYKYEIEFVEEGEE